jgi:cytochrome c peroxidase
MNRGRIVLLVAAVSAIAGLGLILRAVTTESSSPAGTAEFTRGELEEIFTRSPLGEPPADPTNSVYENPGAAGLGQRLFFDRRLSKDGTVSCALCHPPERSFADGHALPERFAVDRNVPSLWNVSWNRWFFWDGRADSLWSQALQPIENPREQAATRLQAAHLVLEDPALRAAYERVFGPAPDLSDASRFPPRGSPLALPPGSALHAAWTSMAEADQVVVNRVYSNLGKSIAAYERQLVSRRSPFDVFVEGLKTKDPEKMKALSPQARQGLKLFIGKANCRLCHVGPNFTDGEFHNIGIPASRGGPAPGRFAAIGELRKDVFNTKGAFSDARAEGEAKLDFLVQGQDQWGQIKTPSLRNVAKTAPYMHQGQFKTLEEVVLFYSTLQGMVQEGHPERALLTPLHLTPLEIVSLVAFLESLTDEKIDERLLKPLE